MKNTLGSLAMMVLVVAGCSEFPLEGPWIRVRLDRVREEVAGLRFVGEQWHPIEREYDWDEEGLRVPRETYRCFPTGPGQTYSWDGQTLTLWRWGFPKATRFRFELEDGIARTDCPEGVPAGSCYYERLDEALQVNRCGDVITASSGAWH